MSTNAKHILYLEDGKSITEEEWTQLDEEGKKINQKAPLVVAKHLSGDIDTYYALFSSSQLFDPTNTDLRYRVRNLWKMRRLSKETFELYLRFLNTKNKLLLKIAEREV